ncbi:Acetyltransferase, GNAT [Bacillus cereus AH1272]|nr:Acetyltransferase, GNAT [Bacillus cereus AH1272]
MEEKYMNVIQLKDDKFREALRLSEYAFQYKANEEWIEQKIARMKESHQIYGIMEGEELAAKLHLIPFHIYIGKEKFKMGGVAGVATYPEYRRSGYVKELLQHSLQTMKKMDIQYRCYIHLQCHFTVNMDGNYVRIAS